MKANKTEIVSGVVREKARRSPSQFVVTAGAGDDQSHLMGWDEECPGALCKITLSAALFQSRKNARKAIEVSTKLALLRRAQGQPANGDFIGKSRKNIHIVRCQPCDLPMAA